VAASSAGGALATAASASIGGGALATTTVAPR
jgi:hypothetical protein